MSDTLERLKAGLAANQKSPSLASAGVTYALDMPIAIAHIIALEEAIDELKSQLADEKARADKADKIFPTFWGRCVEHGANQPHVCKTCLTAALRGEA